MLSLYDVRKPGILQGDPQARAKDWPNDEGRGGGVISRPVNLGIYAEEGDEWQCREFMLGGLIIHLIYRNVPL